MASCHLVVDVNLSCRYTLPFASVSAVILNRLFNHTAGLPGKVRKPQPRPSNFSTAPASASWLSPES
eukprot:6980908-Heterocapsa_arctica.AAC.1